MVAIILNTYPGMHIGPFLLNVDCLTLLDRNIPQPQIPECTMHYSCLVPQSFSHFHMCLIDRQVYDGCTAYPYQSVHNVSVGVALQPKTTREVTQSVPLLITQEFPARDRKKKKEEPIGGGGLWEVQLFVAPFLLNHSRVRGLGGHVELEGR